MDGTPPSQLVTGAPDGQQHRATTLHSSLHAMKLANPALAQAQAPSSAPGQQALASATQVASGDL